MVFLLEVAVIHWQMEQSPVLLPLSKVSPGEYSQRLRGAGAFVPPFLFFKNLGKLEFRMSLGYGNRTAHGFTAVMGLSFLPRLLSLQVWLLLRIPAASEIYFLEEV